MRHANASQRVAPPRNRTGRVATFGGRGCVALCSCAACTPRESAPLAILDFELRELTLNLVYFGPRKAGSGTNVRQLHRVQPAREKAELVHQGGDEHRERLWSFIYRPAELPRIPGFEIAVRVGSVPSEHDNPEHTDTFMQGVDGVCFVADARANRVADNLAALLELERILARQSLQLASIPLVFQVNQVDAPNARPTARVMEEINPFGMPVFEAVARQGKGVFETHEALLHATITRLKDNLGGRHSPITLTALSASRRDRDEHTLLAHIEGLPTSSSTPNARLNLAPIAEIYLRPPELRESRPVNVVRAHVVGEQLRVEAVVRREDGSSRKLALVIEPGAAGAAEPIEDYPTEPIGGPTAPGPHPPPTPSQPHHHHAHPHERDEANDLPGIAYGLAGLFGGGVSGLLLGYILYG